VPEKTPEIPGNEAFERLLGRLRIPQGRPEAALAAGVWREALDLAAPVSMRLRLDTPDFLTLFAPHAQASSHLMDRLRDRPVVWLLAATIGPALEERVRDLFESGQAFSGYVLDFFGVWLADQAMRREIQALRDLAGSLPGSLTGRLMPGCRGFPIQAQAVFVDLAGEGLGLGLTSGWQLTPQKSVTAVIGHRP